MNARRLQVVAPYATHRKSVRYNDANYDSPASMSMAQQEEIAYKTINATPRNRGLTEKRGAKGPLAARAAYLIRDTMKVVGHSDVYGKPLCALFSVRLDDPMEGGTGHTIRVCHHEGVPVVFQDSWAHWTEPSFRGGLRGAP